MYAIHMLTARGAGEACMLFTCSLHEGQVRHAPSDMLTAQGAGEALSPFLYAASSLYEYRRHAFYCWDRF
jgi:hypothetical protein